jgi:hypothetical protein
LRTNTACLVAVLAYVLAVPAVAAAAPRSHQVQTWKNVTILDQRAPTQSSSVLGACFVPRAWCGITLGPTP